MVALEIIFWCCLAVIAWETLAFPGLLWLLARMCPRPTAAADITPAVSIIISAHNEAAHLREKIANTLALDYPSEKREIIVADDGSNDGTDDIARAFAAQGVRLVRQEEWRGKTAVQNLAAVASKGEILVFSDAAARYEAGAVRALVRHFADPRVGCVTGRVVLSNIAFSKDSEPATAAGLAGRLRYEQKVRQLQGESLSLFGASGCIYAVRRDLYTPVAEDQVSDLVLPLMLLARGFRTAYEPGAVASLEREVSSAREFSRRSRVVLQCLRAMWHMRRLLRPWPAGVLVAVVAWYRLLRWLLPLFLAGLLVSNIALAVSGRPVYLGLLVGQLALFAVALLAKCLPPFSLPGRAANLVFLFFWLNLAAAAALLRLLTGEKGITWDSARGR